MSDLEQPGLAPTDSAAPAEITSAPLADNAAALLGTPQADPASPEDELSALAALLPEDDGLEEIDHEGIKAKVPKALKDAFLRQQDYTRKTQEVAEQRRQIEANHAAIQQQTAFQREHIQEVANIIAIDRGVAGLDAQIAEYRRLDMPGIYAQDPQRWQQLDTQLRALERQKNDLQGHRGQIVNSLTHKEQQQALNKQQATAKQIQESQRELEREIKGWSPELGSKLVEYAKKSGLPDEAVSVTTPPWLVRLVHKASQLDQLIAQRTAKPAATPATPPSRVGAKASTAVTDPDKLSPDEWKKWRANQIEAQRKKR